MKKITVKLEENSEVDVILPEGWKQIKTGVLKAGDKCFYPFNENGEYDKYKNPWEDVTLKSENPDYADEGEPCKDFYAVIRSSNPFKNYRVRYWDHSSFQNGGRINDCYSNSHALEVRARSEGEAIRKAEKKVAGIFRLFRVELLTK